MTHQIQQTYKDWTAKLREIGENPAELEVKNGGGSKHLIMLQGQLIGAYNYMNGRLWVKGNKARVWDLKSDRLIYYDEKTGLKSKSIDCTFEELIERSKQP